MAKRHNGEKNCGRHNGESVFLKGRHTGEKNIPQKCPWGMGNGENPNYTCCCFLSLSLSLSVSIYLSIYLSLSLFFLFWGRMDKLNKMLKRHTQVERQLLSCAFGAKYCFPLHFLEFTFI